MKKLYVLYDGGCAFCRRIRSWLDRQPAYVTLTFIPLGAPELACRFPGIEALAPEKEIVVISDAGDVWQGGHAWITVLWALREYREWSLRLAHPALVPLARKVCALVSENRHAISRWFSGSSAAELKLRIESLPEECVGDRSYCRPR